MVHTIDWSLATLIAEDAYWGKPREWYIVKGMRDILDADGGPTKW